MLLMRLQMKSLAVIPMARAYPCRNIWHMQGQMSHTNATHNRMPVVMRSWLWTACTPSWLMWRCEWFGNSYDVGLKKEISVFGHSLPFIITRYSIDEIQNYYSSGRRHCHLLDHHLQDWQRGHRVQWGHLLLTRIRNWDHHTYCLHVKELRVGQRPNKDSRLETSRSYAQLEDHQHVLPKKISFPVEARDPHSRILKSSTRLTQ